MADDEVKSLTVRIGDVEKGFSSLRQLSNWVEEENAKWDWVQHSGYGRVWDRLHKARNAINSRMSEAKAKREPIERVVTTIQDEYRQRHLLSSDSPEGHFVEAVREREGPNAAACALAGLLDGVQIPDAASASQIASICRAAVFKLGVLETAEAERQALNSLREAHSKEMSEQREEQCALTEDYRNTTGLIAKSRDTFASDSREQLAQQLEQWNELTRRYTEQLQLKAPVDYWERERKRHESERWFFGGAAIGVGAVLLCLLWCALWNWMPQAPAEGRFVDYLPIARFSAILLVSITLGVWALRVLVRLFLASMHLRQDAAERAVMANTFLALIEDDKAREHMDSKDDRILVLQALFRHSSDGVVVDDAMPDWAATLLSRLRGGQS